MIERNEHEGCEPPTRLKWDELVIPLRRDDVLLFVRDEKWQLLRLAMVGTTLETRFERLKGWLEQHNYEYRAKVQVANYVNALKRGGMVK